MICLYGYEPYTEMPIVFTGLRPGEKLYEELSYDLKDFDTTSHSDIFVEKPNEVNIEKMRDNLMALDVAVKSGDDERVIAALQQVVPDYVPNRG